MNNQAIKTCFLQIQITWWCADTRYYMKIGAIIIIALSTKKSLSRVITQMLQIKTIKTHYQKYDCQVSKIVFYVKLFCVPLRLSQLYEPPACSM